MALKYNLYSGKDWSNAAAIVIHNTILDVVLNKGKCSVVLTGGKSATHVYSRWKKIDGFRCLAGVNFFLGDERCVPRDHPASNFKLVMDNLFDDGIPTGCTFSSCDFDVIGNNTQIIKYQDMFPKIIDVLLVSVADDGHIASIFPDSKVFDDINSRIAYVEVPAQIQHRITITPNVVKKANKIYVFAPGITKFKIFNAVLKKPQNHRKLPACLVAHGEWFLNIDD
jgi:6-phosphogluconolactonase